jgi:hypothetical protein
MHTQFLLLLLAAAAMLSLSGCDQGKNITIKDKNGSVTISANGQHVGVHASDGKDGDVTISGNGGNFTVHTSDGNSTVEVNANGVSASSNLPAFVNVYPGAKVVSSVSGGGDHGSGGTVAFETGAAPATVIGFYKQKAAASGFTQNLDANDSGSLIYAATSGDKTIQVLASKDSTGTHAQVTWSGH